MTLVLRRGSAPLIRNYVNRKSHLLNHESLNQISLVNFTSKQLKTQFKHVNIKKTHTYKNSNLLTAKLHTSVLNNLLLPIKQVDTNSGKLSFSYLRGFLNDVYNLHSKLKFSLSDIKFFKLLPFLKENNSNQTQLIKKFSSNAGRKKPTKCIDKCKKKKKKPKKKSKCKKQDKCGQKKKKTKCKKKAKPKCPPSKCKKKKETSCKKKKKKPTCPAGKLNKPGKGKKSKCKKKPKKCKKKPKICKKPKKPCPCVKQKRKKTCDTKKKENVCKPKNKASTCKTKKKVKGVVCKKGKGKSDKGKSKKGPKTKEKASETSKTCPRKTSSATGGKPASKKIVSDGKKKPAKNSPKVPKKAGKSCAGGKKSGAGGSCGTSNPDDICKRANSGKNNPGKNNPGKNNPGKNNPGNKVCNTNGNDNSYPKNKGYCYPRDSKGRSVSLKRHRKKGT